MISDTDLLLPLLLEEKQLSETGKKRLEKLARQLIRKKPETRTSDEYFVLGYAADQVYDLDAALGYFSEAISGNPDFEAAYRFRGSVYLRQEKYGEAEADINKALELDPGYRDAKIEKARLLHETGKGETAIGIIEDLETSDDTGEPDHGLTLLKGKVYDRMGRYTEALACYDQVIGATDGDTETYTQRALTRYFSGDADGALSDLNEAHKSGPQGHVGHFNMGLVLLSFHDRTRDAFRYFERAFKKDQNMLKNYLTTANELESERLYDALKDRLTDLKKQADEQGRFYREQLIDLLERKLP